MSWGGTILRARARQRVAERWRLGAGAAGWRRGPWAACGGWRRSRGKACVWPGLWPWQMLVTLIGVTMLVLSALLVRHALSSL